MNEPWKIVLFGDISAHFGEFEITRFRTHKIAGLLAYLAYHRGRSHTREALIDLFWPDQDLEAGRNCLSVALSSLRAQLEGTLSPAGSVIVADRSTVRMSSDAVTTDVAEFVHLLGKAEKCASDVEKSVLFRAALNLYRGPLLGGFYDDWIQPHQRHLEEKYFHTLDWLIQDRARRGDIEAAMELAYLGSTMDPLREDIHFGLLKILKQAGRLPEALAHYRRVAEILQRAGSSPSPSLERLGDSLPSQGASPVSADAFERQSETIAAGSVSPAGSAAHGTYTFLWAEAVGDVGAPARPVDEEEERERRARRLETIERCARANGGSALSPERSSLRWSFDGAADALAAALEAQRVLRQDAEEMGGVRMALDTIDLPSGDVDDAAPRRRAFQERLDAVLASAHSGQILCGESTALLLRQDCVLEVGFRDLGRYQLAGDIVRIFQAAAPGLPAAFPPIAAPSGEPASLPLSFNRFFGRVLEIEELSRILLDAPARLVTLSGVGGVGKTRLALETARRLEDRWRGRAFFIPLTGVDTEEAFLRGILTALRVSAPLGTSLSDTAAAAFAEEPTLLILDNFDQLVDSAAGAVREMIERSPRLTCLITSRCLLGLSFEQEFVVSPLSAPPASASFQEAARSETIQFFVDRARIVRPDFQMTAANTGALLSLCHGLEGIPLAIELAAARSSVLTPKQMLEQLSDRFALLSGGKRDAPDRHKTMRAAIAWSHHLLPEDLARSFRRLSVFHGGFTLDAAGRICDDPEIFEHIWRLRQFSLVLAEEAPSGLRYRMLETVREYAAELLAASDEAETIRTRHWRFYYDLAHAIGQKVESSETEAALQCFDEECANLRLALQYPASQDRRLYFASSLHRFWLIRGFLEEGRRRLHELLDEPLAGDPHWRGVAQNAAGALDWADGDLMSAEAMFRGALAAMPEESEQACLLNNLGLVLTEQERLEEAKHYFLESIERYSRLGDTVERAMALSNLARVEECSGDYEGARARLSEAIPVLWRSGNRLALANALRNYGHVLIVSEEFEEARKLFQENWRIRRELNDRSNFPDSLRDMALMAHHSGSPESAARLAALSDHLQNIGRFPSNSTEDARFQILTPLLTGDTHEERRLVDSAAWTTMTEPELLTLAENVASIDRDMPIQHLRIPQTFDYARIR
ncbi:hypothetical protein CCAX7_009700 [Capsulimonas corticalis]|uniref:Uncharacterized protein n=1 Tax=Capsulimonas corticalis TaxID=2219043 RepID=A0A402CUB6_9BACT|nr:tetratricopeptide repeat protein [Capsulimonas corticalis]BDI28919.1 hypothetical protein CCAX7_009700 [Capsulimonas corticalis]